MQYTHLGSTGTRVSRLCFGTWRFGKQTADGTVETDRETAHDLLDACLDLGINFVDTANVYGDPSGTAERWIGEWLEDHDRDDFVIASKVYFDFDEGPNDRGLSRKHVREQIDGTLERLGTDYLDVYYIHRWDEGTPIEETLATLSDLVRAGTVHYIGASAVAAWKLTKALWTSDVHDYERFEVTQPRYHAVGDAAAEYHPEYLEVCIDQDLAVCPYSPLAGGFLTGKYEREGDEVVGPEGSRADLYDDFADWYVDDASWAVVDELRALADETDATPAQVALRWLMDQPYSCIPIVGARSAEQLEENAGAVDVSLSDEQIDRITDAQAA